MMSDNVIFNNSLRAKKISLRIKQGKIILTIPFNKGLEEKAANFLKLHFEFLSNKLQKFHKISLKIGSEISILGNKYHINLNDDEKHTTIILRENQLLLPKKICKHQEKYIKQFLSFYLKEAINKIADELCSKITVFYQKINIKELKTKWGSCSSQGNLSFNWRLILFDPDILEYVVVHEICHLKEMNHSQKFWQLVQNYCPNWKYARKWLKSEGIYFL